MQSCIDDSLAYSFATSEYWGAWCGNWTCWNNMANTWTHIYSGCAYSYSGNGVVLTSSSITNNNSFAVILEPDNAERTFRVNPGATVSGFYTGCANGGAHLWKPPGS